GSDELERARAAGLREGHVHPHRGPELPGRARDRAAGPRLPDLRARRGRHQEGPGGSKGEGRRNHRARVVRLRDRSRAGDPGRGGRVEAPAAAGRQGGCGRQRRAQPAAAARVLPARSGAATRGGGPSVRRTRMAMNEARRTRLLAWAGAAILLSSVLVGAQEDSRRLWDSAFLAKREPAKAKPRPAKPPEYRVATPTPPATAKPADTAAPGEFLGVTVWRLRR